MKTQFKGWESDFSREMIKKLILKRLLFRDSQKEIHLYRSNVVVKISYKSDTYLTVSYTYLIVNEIKSWNFHSKVTNDQRLERRH